MFVQWFEKRKSGKTNVVDDVLLSSGVIVVLGKTFSDKAKVGMSRLRKMFKARQRGEGTKSTNQRSQQHHHQQQHHEQQHANS
jgi:hypothetical protein